MSFQSLVLVLPDGVGVRNFLLGSFLPRMAARAPLHVLQNIPPALLCEYGAGLDGRIAWHPLLAARDSRHSAFTRYALASAHLYWSDTAAARCNLRLPLRGSRRARLLARTARFTGWMAASTSGIRLLERWHRTLVDVAAETARYRALLERLRPSLVFSSNQRAPSVLPVVLAARSLGIPTATFIFSWDNLTSKGRIVAPFDHYLVWSDHMRRELLRYYPDIRDECIHVVGTVQFDSYADTRLLWSRETFFARIGGDPARPLVCYSAGETNTCPEDPQHVRILLDLIRHDRIRGRPQVLLRPTPADDDRRFDGVRREYPELLYQRPAWIRAAPGDWTAAFPQRADVELLANVTAHADVNVNVASTMTLDFAIRDRPVVNIAFDVADPPPFGVPLCDHYYRFEHYRPVIELTAARIAYSPAQLAELVSVALEAPRRDGEARRRFVDLEVGVPVGESGRRIVETLERIHEGLLPV